MTDADFGGFGAYSTQDGGAAVPRPRHGAAGQGGYGQGSGRMAQAPSGIEGARHGAAPRGRTAHVSDSHVSGPHVSTPHVSTPHAQPAQGRAGAVRFGAAPGFHDHSAWAQPGRVAPDLPGTAHPETGRFDPVRSPRFGRGQRIVNLLGAFGSVALVLSLGWWGWDLAMRDVRGVPVVRALEGPMRMAPEDPGGAVIDHQGLAVNDVPAVGGAAPPPDRLVLAPRPVELAPEDAPGLAMPDSVELSVELSAELSPAPMPGMAVGPDPGFDTGMTALAEAPATMMPLETAPESAPVPMDQEAAVAAALAEALGLDDLSDGMPGGLVETATLDDQGRPAPPGAITRSPRPMPRPDRLATASASAATAPARASAVAPVAVDPDTLAPGTRLVQFGAYDSTAIAEQEWIRLTARFGDLMEGKQMVIQAAESGGRTFWRLRALGFNDEQDSRRFCAALEAESTRCIPVAHR
ncbi:SPOR domain-containing protein [Pseudogemmobacter sonorensis]|uniref:SPOR domain-containing protein n=1 Tax=Pseudogemmobacter sonorensis TaxID=2989681 RepID=UPI0036747BFC